MKTNRAIWIVSVLAVMLTSECHANLNGSDDFNDNFKDPTRWGPVFTQGCCGLLAETNGRLEFTKSSGTSSALVVQPWILNFGSYTQNWEVQIDACVPHLGFPESVFGLGVTSGTNTDFNSTNSDSNNRFSISLFESDTPSRIFLMRFGVKGGTFDRVVELDTTSTFAGLRIAFDANTKVLSAFYDEDGPNNGYSWTLLGSTNISAAWSMSSTSVFGVFVQGRAEADVVASTDNLFGDNFYAFSAWEGTDDFSSGISAANWTPQQMSHGQMTVVGTNDHVSFLVPNSTTAEQSAHIIWQGTPTAAEDWMVDITGHNSAAYSSASSSQLQLAVVDTASLTSVLRGYRVSRRRADDGSFSAAQWIGSGYSNRADVSATAVDFLLRLVYHSASRQIEAWYDPTAFGLGWTKLDTISLSDFSPSMTASSTFTFAILGNTSYGPITEGDIWADSFRAMPTPPSLLVADAQHSAGAEVLHLTWTNNGSMCLLESAGALTGGWSTVSTPWTTNAGWVSTTVTNSSAAQFYRLRAN